MEKIKKGVNKSWRGLLLFLGFWLSPLSPWNDIFTNIPIAYVFGFLFSLISDTLFFPAVVGGYWLSNVAGFVLMHYGYAGMKGRHYSFSSNWERYLIFTTLYTAIMAALIWFNILPSAGDIVSFIKR